MALLLLAMTAGLIAEGEGTVSKHRRTLLVRLALVESLVAAAGIALLLFLDLVVDPDALSAAAGFARF